MSEINRPCHCCGKNISDPEHTPLEMFFLVFFNAQHVARVERGPNAAIQLNPYNKKPVVAINPFTGQAENIIHTFLKLDGNDRPQIDTLEDLLSFVGWGDMLGTKLVEFFQIFGFMKTLFEILQLKNPTPDTHVDLIDLLAVIKDSGWEFYETLSACKTDELFLDNIKVRYVDKPALTRPVYVGGGEGGQLSFPTHFAHNGSQARAYQFKSWMDFLLFLDDATSITFFLLGLGHLWKDNHFWAVRFWDTHRHINGHFASSAPSPRKTMSVRFGPSVDAEQSGSVKPPAAVAKEAPDSEATPGWSATDLAAAQKERWQKKSLAEKPIPQPQPIRIPTPVSISVTPPAAPPKKVVPHETPIIQTCPLCNAVMKGNVCEGCGGKRCPACGEVNWGTATQCKNCGATLEMVS